MLFCGHAISAHASRMFLRVRCCPVLKKLPCAVCVREKKAPRALCGCGPPAGISAAARTCGPSSPEWLRGKNRRTAHLGKLISPSDSNPKMFSSGGVCYECEGLRVSFQKVPKPLWRHFAGKVACLRRKVASGKPVSSTVACGRPVCRQSAAKVA